MKSYKQFGGAKKPNIAIVEFRHTYSSGQSEYELFRDFFRDEGYLVEIVSPEQLEYRNGVLRKGSFEIDLVYRRLGVQEFLIRFDLTHPLVQAYRDRAVCVVNSFRSELAHKKAMFGLLTDEAMTVKFPAVERKAIRDHVPWTRLVSAARTTYDEKPIDLPEFITLNRERLALKPNDDYSDQHTYFGWEMDSAGWDRALKQAMRAPYVVQERVEPVRGVGLPVDDLRPPGIPRDARWTSHPTRRTTWARCRAAPVGFPWERPGFLLRRRHRADLHSQSKGARSAPPNERFFVETPRVW